MSPVAAVVESWFRLDATPDVISFSLRRRMQLLDGNGVGTDGPWGPIALDTASTHASDALGVLERVAARLRELDLEVVATAIDAQAARLRRGPIGARDLFSMDEERSPIAAARSQIIEGLEARCMDEPADPASCGCARVRMAAQLRFLMLQCAEYGVAEGDESPSWAWVERNASAPVGPLGPLADALREIHSALRSDVARAVRLLRSADFVNEPGGWIRVLPGRDEVEDLARLCASST